MNESVVMIVYAAVFRFKTFFRIRILQSYIKVNLNTIIELKGGGPRNVAVRTRPSWLPGERRDI